MRLRATPISFAPGLFLAVAFAASASAQASDTSTARLRGSFQGPRIGITILDDGVQDRLERHNLDRTPMIMQFGWQWEQRFVIDAQAPVLASGLMFLIGGPEQGMLLPSLSWLIGIRSRDGAELGLGPVLSLTGANLAIGAGVSTRKGDVNIPFNMAIVLGEPGIRFSLLTGFNMNRRALGND